MRSNSALVIRAVGVSGADYETPERRLRYGRGETPTDLRASVSRRLLTIEPDTSWLGRGNDYRTSGKLKVEGVDLLRADVAGEQGDSAGADTGPGGGTELVPV